MKVFTGTWQLTRLALRRDRVMLPLWILGITLVVASGANSIKAVFDTPESRTQLAADMGSNPTFQAFYGPLHGDSLGAILAWRYGAMLSILAALMGMLVMVRHTRAEEESGRLELVSAGRVGRLAPLTASLITVYGAALVLAGFITLALLGADLPRAGSLALGLEIAAGALVFGSVAAFAAQITESARLANGITGIVLGGTVLLRFVGSAAGDAGPAWLIWASPNGWATEMRAFAGDRFWTLGFAAATMAVFVAAAYIVGLRRDFAAGLVRPRLGRAEAAPGLRSSFALAWRLQRGSLIGWTIGLAAGGAAVGSSAGGIADLFEDTPEIEEAFMRLGQGTIVDVYMKSILSLLAMVVAVYTVQAVLRLRAEETGFLAEPILATRVGRVRWVCGHLVFAIAGTAVILAVTGAAAGLTYGIAAEDVGTQLGRATGTALAQLPAVWTLAGLAVALFGLLPRLLPVAWGAIVLFLLISLVGPLLQLDQWALDLSPYTHIPAVTGDSFTATPLIWLVAITAALTAAGLAGFRRRDVG